MHLESIVSRNAQNRYAYARHAMIGSSVVSSIQRRE